MSESDVVEVTALGQWRDWLRRHHTRETGAWVVYLKRSSGRAEIDYEELVCEALCWGWIDSKTERVDDLRTRLWFAPRRSASTWSTSNKRRVERLAGEGRMKPAGLRAVAQAKATGRWTTMEAVERLEVPPDLAAALRRHTGAKRQWEGFTPSSRRVILQWIALAKRPATRVDRIERTAACAARGEKVIPPTPRVSAEGGER
ncbi:MAG: YdeI family protein [Acidimicrobiales bacterium]